MRNKSININSPNKQCGNCRYRVELGTNSRGQQFGQMVVADVIYTKVNDTPYNFMQ